MEEGRSDNLLLAVDVSEVEKQEQAKIDERRKAQEAEAASAKKIKHLSDALRFNTGEWKGIPYKGLTGSQQRQLAPESCKLVERGWREYDLGTPEGRAALSDMLVNEKTIGTYVVIDQERVFSAEKRLLMVLLERYEFKHIV